MKKLISSKEYHEDSAVGSSILKEIHKTTVAHAMVKTWKDTEDKLIGLYVHALLLEPEKISSEFAILPICDRRTKGGKAIYEAFCLSSEGKKVIEAESAETARKIADSIMSHPVAKEMLVDGESEYSYFAKDEVTGLQRKCRPDYKKMGALIDVKTTRDASYEGFAREIGNWSYHLQAAYYIDTHNLATSENVKEFYIIAAEKEAPFAVAVYQLSEHDIEVGRDAYKKALKEYADFLKASEAERQKFKHGYAPIITVISMPFYMHNNIKVEA